MYIYIVSRDAVTSLDNSLLYYACFNFPLSLDKIKSNNCYSQKCVFINFIISVTLIVMIYVTLKFKIELFIYQNILYIVMFLKKKSKF